jgi:hypothetical protein
LGDTFGLSVERAPRTSAPAGWRDAEIVVSWGSAVGGKYADSEDRAAIVTF